MIFARDPIEVDFGFKFRPTPKSLNAFYNKSRYIYFTRQYNTLDFKSSSDHFLKSYILSPEGEIGEWNKGFHRIK